MAYVCYVFISKPSFRVIKIAQREIVSGSLLLLCALTLILRLRGFESRGLRLCAIREFGLRGLRLRTIRVRVRARVILKITSQFGLAKKRERLVGYFHFMRVMKLLNL